jgi:hypothetical protein
MLIINPKEYISVALLGSVSAILSAGVLQIDVSACTLTKLEDSIDNSGAWYFSAAPPTFGVLPSPLW